MKTLASSVNRGCLDDSLRTSPETVNRVARRMLEGPGRRRRKDDLVYDGRYRIEVSSDVGVPCGALKTLPAASHKSGPRSRAEYTGVHASLDNQFVRYIKQI